VKKNISSSGGRFQTVSVGANRTLIAQAASQSEGRLAVLAIGAFRIAALTAAIFMLSSFVILAPKCAWAGDAAKANYVGVEACTGCDQEQAERWKTSHHALPITM
jgi:hypothetical protein